MILLSIVLMSALSFTSCSKDDDNAEGGGSNPPSSNVSKPEFVQDLTRTTVGGYCNFKCRFSNGGDVKKNMTCKVYMKEYSSKPSKTPRSSALTSKISMSISGSTSSTTDFLGGYKGHAGYVVYYMFECANSGRTSQSAVYSVTLKK